jgi:transposase
MLKGIGMSKAAVVSTQARIRQTRRRWPIEQKRRIVEATFTPGVSIAQVAREYGVNANQLHSWRRLHQAGRLGAQSPQATLLPVRVVAESAGTVPAMVTSLDPERIQRAAKPRRGRTPSLMQVDTPRGRLHIQGAADPWTLRIVLESLLA